MAKLLEESVWFSEKYALQHVSDGRVILLQTQRGHVLLGFKRRQCWLTTYGIPVDEKVIRVNVYKQPPTIKGDKGEK